MNGDVATLLLGDTLVVIVLNLDIAGLWFAGDYEADSRVE